MWAMRVNLTQTEEERNEPRLRQMLKLRKDRVGRIRCKKKKTEVDHSVKNIY